jgi:hypothetical protein
MNYPHVDTVGTTAGLTTSTSVTPSTTLQSGYYPLTSNIYSYRNIPPQGYAPISYTPYSTVPTSYVQQTDAGSILSEKQFYEYQERLRRE